MLWAFWIACVLAAAGGLAPFVFGGTSNRMGGAIIPFGIAAVAMALNALLHHQGRRVPTLLYFIAGVGIVYGILYMIAIPLQLAVLGSCPPPPDTCQPGQQSALTGGEGDGLASAVILGFLAIAAGFVGLAMFYRRKPKLARIAPAPVAPMPRSKPPIASKAVVSEPEPVPAEVAPAAAAPVAVNEAAVEPEAAVETAPPPEVEPPPLELAAHEQNLELAAHEPEPEPPATHSAPAPMPERQARSKRQRKRHPEPPPAAGLEPPPDLPPSS